MFSGIGVGHAPMPQIRRRRLILRISTHLLKILLLFPVDKAAESTTPRRNLPLNLESIHLDYCDAIDMNRKPVEKERETGLTAAKAEANKRSKRAIARSDISLEGKAIESRDAFNDNTK